MEVRNTPHFRSKTIGREPVYKDECCKCFRDTFEPDGVFVCLVKLIGYCKKHADKYAQKTGRHYFLNITQKKLLNEQQEAKKETITKLAIGVEGGIDSSKKYEIETNHKLAYLGPGESQIKEEEVAGLIKSIMESDSANKKEDIQAWENQIHACEHTLTLDQSFAQKIARKDLAHCGLCDLDNNLWICLECGHLGCGRKFYDGTGGNGHALAHYESSGHALAVKSGTISLEGKASVFCYKCDEDVDDPELPAHLLVLGIKVEDMKKTEKTMAEISLEANLTLTLSNSFEKGKKLFPVFGPKKTGLDNIGNSCYLASVIQCLAHIPEFQRRYFELAEGHTETCKADPPACLLCQTCRLFSGLLSGEFSIKQVEETVVPSTSEVCVNEFQDGVKPTLFRSVVGKGHSEFSTKKQQDAMEYLIHFLNCLTKSEANSQLAPLSDLFDFKIETLIECPNCPVVVRKEISSKILTLPVPLPDNFDTYGDTGKQEDMEYAATLSDCIDLFIHSEKSSKGRCDSCNKEGLLKRRKYLRSFPKYLIVQLTNFAMNGWVPKKLHCNVDFGQLDAVSLGRLVAPESQKQVIDQDSLFPGKKEEEAAISFDEGALGILMSMGFSENRSKRALMETGNNAENALNFIMSTLDDATQDNPIESKKKTGSSPNAGIETLVEAVWPTAESMGIEKKYVYAAAELRNSPDEVLNYLFENMEELERIIQQKESSMTAAHDNASYENSSKPNCAAFEVIGSVVHLGRSVHVGHYIAYGKQPEGWIYFNDSKVALSEAPQIGKSYICILRRKD